MYQPRGESDEVPDGDRHASAAPIPLARMAAWLWKPDIYLDNTSSTIAFMFSSVNPASLKTMQ